MELKKVIEKVEIRVKLMINLITNTKSKEIINLLNEIDFLKEVLFALEYAEDKIEGKK